MDTVLDIKAVEAMLADKTMTELMKAPWRRSWLNETALWLDTVPDWINAALNCTNDADILPMAMHTFLMDWKPEAAK